MLVLLASGASAQDRARDDVADTGPSRALDAPADLRAPAAKFWHSDEWFDRGLLDSPANHAVERLEVAYVNPADRTEVPALLFRPRGGGRHPAVLFAHGRRGLDELVERLALRIAARGFAVLAPNLFAARFVAAMPVAHDPMTESDLAAGLDALLRRPEVSTTKACLASHTRGGYYALRLAVTHGRQDRDLACYVSSYPHWQDPGAPEPDQVYRYAGEVDRLALPTLIFVGEYEQYQRRRSIETAVAAMKSAHRDVRLVIYPGVGRGFDFRPPEVRTFADDLAAKDAVQRSSAFMHQSLQRWSKN